MDYNKLKFTRLENEIFEFLFRNPSGEFTGKELASSLGFSQTAISKSIRRLSKLGLLNVKKKVILSISLNREKKEIYVLKRLFNLREIYFSGLIDKLSESFPGASVVLFGSYFYGEDMEDSDIDIALLGYSEKKMNLNKIEIKLNRKIQLHFFEKSEDIEENLRENIFNGIVLCGVLKI